MTPDTESLELLTKQPKNAKGAIIQKLSREFPLTTKQISGCVNREFGLSITYQAVHKALKELEKDHIVTKEKNQWKLNQSWLEANTSFIQTTQRTYAGKKNHYNIDLKNHNPQLFEFDSFTDFCVETANLVAKKILYQNEEKAYYVLEYGWWPFKFKFEHLHLLYDLKRNSPKALHIMRKKTPFGEWVQKQYERVGGTGTIGLDVPFDEDLYVQGDWVFQVHFSEESKKTILKYWKKWKNLEDCFRAFGLKEEPKISIKVIVTKNPAMARLIKERIESAWKETQ